MDSSHTASTITLGCNAFGERQDAGLARKLVHAALDSGVTCFDTAAHYGGGLSEEYLGAALGSARGQVLISSKCGLSLAADGSMAPLPGRGRREFVVAQCEASLRRLGAEKIDFFFLHRHDPDTPLDETIAAFDALRSAGKIGSAGVCNLPADLLGQFAAAGFAVAQYEYSLAARAVEFEVVPLMERHGMGLMCYFPLAGGMLSGKYRRNAAPPPGSRFDTVARHAQRFLTDENWRLIDGLQALSDSSGRPMLDHALGWLVTRPRVMSVICGASRPEQIVANVAAAAYRPTADELAVLDALGRI